MGNASNEENWATRERLRRVEFLLWWRGWVGRQDLVEGFGISAAQASGDLQKYAALNEGAMIYHTSRKRYEAAEGMRCVLHEPSFEEAVRVFLGAAVSQGRADGRIETAEGRLTVLGLPARRLDVGIARKIMMALLGGKQVRIKYLSLSSGKKEWRVIAPKGLAWDGSRWHVRAWSYEREDFRDFVLGRMIEAEMPKEEAAELPQDEGWETFETLVFQINPALSETQREALRIDYGLVGDRLEISVRACMKYYLLGEWGMGAAGEGADLRHWVRPSD
jgi:hypothetical protein